MKEGNVGDLNDGEERDERRIFYLFLTMVFFLFCTLLSGMHACIARLHPVACIGMAFHRIFFIATRSPVFKEPQQDSP